MRRRNSRVPPRVLTVAGSDSGGGAGIQADIKVVTCLGGYAMSAVTALTAQDTRGVWGVHAVPPRFVAQQVELCLADIGADIAALEAERRALEWEVRAGMVAAIGFIGMDLDGQHLVCVQELEQQRESRLGMVNPQQARPVSRHEFAQSCALQWTAGNAALSGAMVDQFPALRIVVALRELLAQHGVQTPSSPQISS